MYFSLTAAVTEDNRKEGLDLNSVPATKTLGNEYLREKKRLADAQQKKHKPTRASWAKSLDGDDESDVRSLLMPFFLLKFPTLSKLMLYCTQGMGANIIKVSFHYTCMNQYDLPVQDVLAQVLSSSFIRSRYSFQF